MFELKARLRLMGFSCICRVTRAGNPRSRSGGVRRHQSPATGARR